MEDNLNLSLKAQNFLKVMNNLVEKENRINKAMSVFENYTESTRLQGLIENLRVLPEKDLVQMYEGLTKRDDWGALITNFDTAIEKIETASELMKSSRNESMQWNENRYVRKGGVKDGCPCGPPQELIDCLRIAVAAVDLVSAIAQAIADVFLALGGIFVFLAPIAQAIASILLVISRLLALVIAILVREANITEECEKAVLKCLIYQIYNIVTEIDGNVDCILKKLKCIESAIDKCCRRY